MPEMPSWSRQTRLLHAGERAPAPEAPPSATPIYSSTTYVFADSAALEQAIVGGGYVYGRNGNPTTAALEYAMTVAEEGAGALAFASGMAGLHAAILAAGTPPGADHPQLRGILVARDIYGVTTVLLEKFFAAQGVPVRACDMCDLAAVDAALTDFPVSVLVVEQISNPLLRVVDIAALAARAHVAGALLVVDATIATPVLERPLTLGADLVVHSATKYLGGHGDATGGVVVARTPELRAILLSYLKILGGAIGPFEAQLLLRGIKTLTLRVRQQCAGAAVVAAWLATHPGVDRVYYPGLPGHPQHALAARCFGGLFGAMVSFDLRDGDLRAVRHFIDALRLILPATSLGDVYTLVSSPPIASHRDLTPAQRAERGIGEGMIRLSIGIEDPSDLCADLAGALAAVGREV
jgi:cystathionine gamma-synthase/methionine-gamma-lyase